MEKNSHSYIILPYKRNVLVQINVSPQHNMVAAEGKETHKPSREEGEGTGQAKVLSKKNKML